MTKQCESLIGKKTEDSNTLNTSSDCVFSLQETYKRSLEHLVWMSKMPGAKAHAWQRAKQLESDPTGIWRGITEELTGVMSEIHSQNQKAHSQKSSGEGDSQKQAQKQHN